VSAPRYIEIRDQLRERCAELTPGSKLASERALAEEFDVSAMTVRQSLAELVDEGWVHRSPGSGTYVGRPTVIMGPRLTSYTEDMRRLGLQPSSEVMRFETIKPDLETVTRLALRPSEQAVVLERLRFADGEPMCHEIGVFPSRLADALATVDLSGSVHEGLAAIGTMPYSTLRRVRAVVAPERECELLGLPSPSPALEISDTFSDALGQPFQHVRTRYRFDRYEVLSKIDRLSGAGR
jgi:GntR family transcriptional regulator